jgi:hypothetical protein
MTKALEEYPEEWPPNLNLTMFEGKNFTRGFLSAHLIHDEEDEEQEGLNAKCSKELDKRIEEGCEESFLRTLNDVRILQQEDLLPEEVSLKKTFPGQSKNPSTSNLMATGPSTTTTNLSTRTHSRFAAPTAATKARNHTSKRNDAKSSACLKQPVKQQAVVRRSRTASKQEGKRFDRSTSVSQKSLNLIQPRTQPLQFSSQSDLSHSGGVMSHGMIGLTFKEESELIERLRNPEILEDVEGSSWMNERPSLPEEAFEDFCFEVPKV